MERPIRPKVNFERRPVVAIVAITQRFLGFIEASDLHR
jgi:hypothetical protein